MTDYYLDLIDGDNLNDGLSWLTAKKSPNEFVSLAVAADTIKVARTGKYQALPGVWSSTAVVSSMYTVLQGDTSIDVKTLFVGGNNPATPVTGTAYNSASYSTVTVTTYKPAYNPATADGADIGSVNTPLITLPPSPSASTKYGTIALAADVDLSAFQVLCLFIHNGSTTTSSNPASGGGKLLISLCSDTAGDVVLEEFSYEQQLQFSAGGGWYKFRVSGGLPSNVRSIAVYTGVGGTLPFNMGIHAAFAAKDTSTVMPGDYIYSAPLGLWHPVSIISGGETLTPKIYLNNNTTTFQHRVDPVVNETLFCFENNRIYDRADMGTLAPASIWEGHEMSSAQASFTDFTWEGGYNTATGLVDSYTGFTSQGAFVNVPTNQAPFNLPLRRGYTFKNFLLAGCTMGLPNTPTGSSSTQGTTHNYENCVLIRSGWPNTIYWGEGTSFTSCFLQSPFDYDSVQAQFPSLSFTDCTLVYSSSGDLFANVTFTGCNIFPSTTAVLGATATGTTISNTVKPTKLNFVNTVSYGGLLYIRINGYRSQESDECGVSGNLIVRSNLQIDCRFGGAIVEGITIEDYKGAATRASFIYGDTITRIRPDHKPLHPLLVRNCDLNKLSSSVEYRNFVMENCTLTATGAIILSPSQSAWMKFKSCSLVAETPSTSSWAMNYINDVEFYDCTLERVRLVPQASTGQLRMYGGSIIGTLDVRNSNQSPWGAKFHNVTHLPSMAGYEHAFNGMGNFLNPRTAWMVFSSVNGDPTDTRLYSPQLYIKTTDEIARTPPGKSWKVVTRAPVSLDAVIWPVGQVAVKAGTLLTVKMYVYCLNECYATIRVQPGQVGSNDYMEATNTFLQDQWEEVVFSFTPSANGVIEIEIIFTSEQSRTMYLDDISFAQI